MVGIVGAVVAASGSAGFGLGLIPEDLRAVPGVVELKAVPVGPGCPGADSVERVDHSSNMPPVGNQGRQGSCVAWAHGYYQKTHTEFVEHCWEVEEPGHQMSPAFLYNQVNGGQDRGTSGSKVMQLMCEQGCASMADCPYNQNDFTSWPSETAYSAALRFRGLERYWIWAGDTAGLGNVRQHVANGYTCVLGIQVWANFDNIRSFNNIYCSSERYGPMRGWHAVTAVGYDDTLVTSDGRGGFRMVNSWGTGWGDRGYFWMSYVAVMDAQMSGRQMEFASDRIGYQPWLLGRVWLEHPTRDRVGIRLGVGAPGHMLWHQDFRTWREAYIDQPFPDYPIVFDLTEGERYLTGGPADTIFLLAVDDTADAREGVVLQFSAEHREWRSRAFSPDPPVLISDDGIAAVALLHLPVSGVEGTKSDERAANAGPTVVRGGLRREVGSRQHTAFRAELLDITGRSVLELHPGANDVRNLAPGVYFVSERPAVGGQRLAVCKVVVAR